MGVEYLNVQSICSARIVSTALHIASGWGGSAGQLHENATYRDNLTRPLQNAGRSEDCREILRVLVKHGQCDPMTMTDTIEPQHCAPWSMNSLHMFKGPAEGLEYLLKQEEFMLDWEARDGLDLTVLAAQLRYLLPNS